MEDPLLNRIGRGNKVVGFVKDNKAKLTSTPNIMGVHVPNIEALIQMALDNDSKATENTTGLAEHKSDEREELEANLFHVCAGLGAYAESVGDQLLSRLINTTASDLQNLRELPLVQFAELVLEKITTPIAKELEAKFNVSSNDISDLTKSINEFTSYLAKPRQAIAVKKAYREMAILNVKEIDDEIEKIARAMGTYKKSNRLLYEIFEATNTIDDLGVGKSSSEGKETKGTIDANSTEKILTLTLFDVSNAISLSANGGDLVFSVQKGGVPIGNKLLVINGTKVKTTLGALATSGDEIVVTNNNNFVVSWTIVV